MKASKPIPFGFVADYLFPIEIRTRPMFGAYGVYVDERIVFILRKKDKGIEDNGVWIATAFEHHEGLRKIFPSMRSIKIFGPGETEWQLLPESSPDFEESVITACQMVRSNDPRIGKIPKKKKRKES